MSHVLAFDQGTTSSRALLFDLQGEPSRLAQKELTQHYPQPGFVEHDPDEIWRSQLTVAEQVMRAAVGDGHTVQAIGITNQRETAVVWDKATGEPIHRAIVWQDRRTASVCDRMKADGLSNFVREKTGLELDPYFSAAKIAWLLDHVDGARERAERGELCFGTIDSWLLYKLTAGAVHATDATNASRTSLYDLHKGRWSDGLCDLFSVPRAMLPEVRDTATQFGEVAIDGPLKGLPITALVGDQQSATFGQSCRSPGLAKNTYGTGCFLLAHIGDEPRVSQHRLLTTVAWQLEGRREFAFEGSVFIGGAVVQWLRDGLGVIQSSEEIEPLARSVEDTGGVVLVPAFAGLGAPHWDPHARGSISGITGGTTKAHLARAALEAIAFQVADLADAAAADAGSRLASLRVDGGAVVNDLLLQMQADFGRFEVDRPAVTETTALGAAFLAAVGAGLRPASEVTERRSERVFRPELSDDEAVARRALWSRAIERARDWTRGD
ncbi:MAG: glycerol kinase GlpK [Planctomycetota bacterium]